MGWDHDADHATVENYNPSWPRRDALTVFARSIDDALRPPLEQVELERTIALIEEMVADLDMCANRLPGRVDRSRLHLSVLNLSAVLTDGAQTLAKLNATLGSQRERLPLKGDGG